ncbi:MAG: macro domain-containing protein [Promethearchaeota archaeon]
MSTLTRTINGCIIEIFIGDYIHTEYDAMVIPTNSRLLPSGDLRCYVLRNAGSKVQVECNRIINKTGTISVGTAVMTSGGNLKTKYIIHVVGPKINLPKPGKKLALAIWNSLKLADEAGLKTVLFPPLSNEMLGFNAKICAEVMLPAMKKYLRETNDNIVNITICLQDLPDYKNFETVLTGISD